MSRGREEMGPRCSSEAGPVTSSRQAAVNHVQLALDEMSMEVDGQTIASLVVHPHRAGARDVGRTEQFQAIPLVTRCGSLR